MSDDPYELDLHLLSRVSERLAGLTNPVLGELAEFDHLVIIRRGEQFPNGQTFTQFCFGSHIEVGQPSPATIVRNLRAMADQIESWAADR